MSVTDHPDWRAFVRQIRENPGDDTVRLVAADWLEEQGDSAVRRCDPNAVHSHQGYGRWKKGEPIHGVVHETDPRRPHHHCDDKCWASDGKAAVAEMIRQGVACPDYVLECEADSDVGIGCGGDAICPTCRMFTETLGCPRRLFHENSYTVRRGFVETMTCLASSWVAHGDDLLARQPVAEVRLTTWPDISYHYSVMDGHARIVQSFNGDPDGGWSQRSPVLLSCEKTLCARWPGVTFTLPPPEPEWRAFAQTSWVDERAPMTEADLWLLNEAARLLQLRPPVREDGGG